MPDEILIPSPQPSPWGRGGGQGGQGVETCPAMDSGLRWNNNLGVRGLSKCHSG